MGMVYCVMLHHTNRRTDHSAGYAPSLKHTASGLLFLLCATLSNETSADAAWPVTRPDVYQDFTRHIQRQIETDKAAFALASTCTNWLYQQEKHKPAPTQVQPIRWNPVSQSPSREDCLRIYPGGLEAVREDFHRTQTALSVSLTFYEFALVGDRNDDNRYSREELRDLFLSLTLAYDPRQTPGTQAEALAARFDTWYRAKNLEQLMNSMAQLYEKGYRVSAADRAELERVSK